MTTQLPLKFRDSFYKLEAAVYLKTEQFVDGQWVVISNRKTPYEEIPYSFVEYEKSPQLG